ncbi:MAG: S9 family peptidase, partial [Actinomycetota bacterium]|nr:S9 family peptidase [Actinomycetota bacterium]
RVVPSLRDLLELRVAAPADISPDGTTVLVKSNLTGTMQLYRVTAAGGALEQLTDFAEPVDGFFVPRRQRILLQMDEGGNERHQLYLLDADPGGVLEPLVVEPDVLHRTPSCTRDGRLLAYATTRRNGIDFDIVVRDLETGDEHVAFARGGWCEAAGFSPDGAMLTVSRATERSGDNDLYLVDVASGEVSLALPHEDEAYVGAPAWLPDGTGFYVATSAGRDLVGIARYNLRSHSWQYVIEDRWDLECHVDEAGRNLLVEANVDGYSRLELRDPATLEPRDEVALPGRGVVSDVVFSRDGRFVAYHFTSPLVAGDTWLYDVQSGESVRLTTSPGAVAPEELAEPELHRFSSFDGETVPVFLYLPPGPGPFPVVIMIHGGPESQLRPIFNPLAQYFVAAGYAVAAPNVRGSTGYGKRYEHLDDVGKRLDAGRDLVSLHDWLARDGRIDRDRAVLYGGSYGGYMVLAGLAFHPERWAAGVETVGISSLVTFLENTAEWRRAFREREYGSLERDRQFLEEVSPLRHVEAIRAPLFVIHGANDPRVPVGEAEQIHRSLTQRGIRCELLVYPDEGHGLARLHNRLDAYPQAVAFLEEVLGAPER